MVFFQMLCADDNICSFGFLKLSAVLEVVLDYSYPPLAEICAATYDACLPPIPEAALGPSVSEFNLAP